MLTNLILIINVISLYIPREATNRTKHTKENFIFNSFSFSFQVDFFYEELDDDDDYLYK